MANLWIPPSQTNPDFVGGCHICGSQFTRKFLYEQHVVKCADEYGQELQDLHGDMRKWNEPVDPEWMAYNTALKAAGISPDEQYNRGRRSNIRRASES